MGRSIPTREHVQKNHVKESVLVYHIPGAGHDQFLCMSGLAHYLSGILKKRSENQRKQCRDIHTHPPIQSIRLSGHDLLGEFDLGDHYRLAFPGSSRRK